MLVVNLENIMLLVTAQFWHLGNSRRYFFMIVISESALGVWNTQVCTGNQNTQNSTFASEHLGVSLKPYTSEYNLVAREAPKICAVPWSAQSYSNAVISGHPQDFGARALSSACWTEPSGAVLATRGVSYVRPLAKVANVGWRRSRWSVADFLISSIPWFKMDSVRVRWDS